MDEQSTVYEAFLLLETVDECKKFLADLCTPQEMKPSERGGKFASFLMKENILIVKSMPSRGQA